MILTAHGGAFYNREKPFYHPIEKDFPWAVLRLSRYPRFVQENNGTACAKNSTPALTSGLMTEKRGCPSPQRPWQQSATSCGSCAKTSPAVSPRPFSATLTRGSRAGGKPLVLSVSGLSRLALLPPARWKRWWAPWCLSGRICIVDGAKRAFIPLTAP